MYSDFFRGSMIAIILSLLVVLATATYILSRKKRTKVFENDMTDLSIEELSDRVKVFLRNERVEKKGFGVNPVSLMPVLSKEKRLLDEKVRNVQPLSDAEKWYYENFYLVRRFVYGTKDRMRTLPHVNGVPRIVALSKIIVNHSLHGIDGERVRAVLDGIPSADALLYREWRSFSDAFRYALLEQIYVLAERLLQQEKNKRRAYRHAFDERYVKSPTYVRTLYKIEPKPKETLEKLKKKGINEQNAILEYNNVLVKNATMAKTLFTAMRETDKYLPAEIGFRYLSAYRVLFDKGLLQSVSVGTQRSYFEEIEKTADRCTVSEDYCAEKLLELSKKTDTDPTVLLLDHSKVLRTYIRHGKINKNREKSVFFQRLYVFYMILLPIVGSFFIGYFFGIPMGLFSFVPLLFVNENVTNYVLSFFSGKKEVPSLDNRKISYENSLAIVVSEFISTFEQFKDSLHHLTSVDLSNGGENVESILLVDTKGGKEPISQLDREIIRYLQENDLPCGVKVFLRKKSKNGNIYQGKERKRGALLAVNKLFVTRNSEEFLYLSDEFFTPQYVLTLDADNDLLPGEALHAVNMMAHPYNARYTLLTFHSRYNLFSLKTPFSERFLSESGCETYPTFSGLYYDLFRRDVYCGKGIYRLKGFYNATEEVFPEGKILSHDVLEGSVVRSGAGVTVFEDAPQGFLSDRERKKRWMRGDIQLLPFLFGRWRNENGQKVRRKIEPFNRFVMAKNIVAVWKEVALVSALLYGIFTETTALFVAIGIFLLPYVVNEIKAIRRITANDLPRYVLQNVLTILFQSIEDFFLLPYYAVEKLSLFLTTCVGMARKRGLMQWKTYYDSQKAQEIASYARAFCPTMLFMMGVCAFSFFFAPGYLMYIAIISFCIVGIVAELYVSSLPYEKRRHKNTDRLMVRRYAEKTYRFFTFAQSYGYLIADNLQLKPYKGMSEHTSPTNIGFSILAQICGCELRFSTVEECEYTVMKILDEVEKLPKWKGNLYNWYSVQEKKPMTRFVSSVDCGNYTAALIVARSFFRLHNSASVVCRIERLLQEGDLSALFDEGKNLFYLGFDGEKYVGHYDLYNSESRLMSVIYTAYSENKTHFYALSRDFTSVKGNTLLSWSGTAFETLMPELFLSTPSHSMMAETVKNTVIIQKNNRYCGVWGIGESGYFQLDENKKYLYHAFGIGKISMRSEKDCPVISPYSSIMAIDFDEKAVLNNLEKLERLGVFGEHGFYEALDLCKGRNIVRSHMAHHQGMALCAMTNYLCENAIKKYFCSDEKIEAIRTILNETTPLRRCGRKSRENYDKRAIYDNNYSKYIDKIEQYFRAAALTDGKMSIFCNAIGGNFARYSEKTIEVFSPDYDNDFGGYFFVYDGYELYSPTVYSLADSCDPTERESYRFAYDARELHYENVRKKATLDVTMIRSLGCVVRRLRCGENNRVFFHSSVCMTGIADYDAHPAFNGLFVDVNIYGDIAVFRKRSTIKKSLDQFLAVRVIGLDDVHWECNEMNFVGRNRTVAQSKIFDAYFKRVKKDSFSDYRPLFRPHYPSEGDLLYPCVGFTGITAGEECQVVFLVGEDEENVLTTIRSLPDDPYRYALPGVDYLDLSEQTHELLGELLYRPYRREQLSEITDQQDIKLFSERSKNKKLLVYTFSEDYSVCFTSFLRVLGDLRVLSIDVSVGILFEKKPEESVYSFVKKNLEDFCVPDVVFFYDRTEAERFAFLLLRSDLRFERSPVQPYLSPFKDRFSKYVDYHSDDLSYVQENELFLSGNGGFDSKDAYLYHSYEPSGKPYSNVVAREKGGYLVTDNGNGYFYFGNSRENKASRFYNDPVCGRSSERLYLTFGPVSIPLNDGNGQNGSMKVERGKTSFIKRDDRFASTVEYSMICNGLARVITADITLFPEENATLEYVFYPCLDWQYDPTFLTWEYRQGIFFIGNVKNGRRMYLRVFTDVMRIQPKETSVPGFVCEIKERKTSVSIVFSEDYSLISSIQEDALHVYIEREKEYFASLTTVEPIAKERSFSLLAKYLPYQIASSRLLGKLGFYQVGGATGFRDQLQDAAAFLHVDPTVCRRQIVECCQHQYKEGDVMHWWHEPKFGLRTRISDDKLFLPLICAEYLRYTGDLALLEERVPYLFSPLLHDGERTRYEDPPYTKDAYLIKDHCLTAIKSSLKFGEHGLCVMGGGDWNDGMDEIGVEGVGESVFTSMLLYQTMVSFSEFCDEKTKNELLRVAEELRDKINDFAFENDRYKRLYSDDGRWLGGKNCPDLRLDLLVQSYAVLSGVCNIDRANVVLDTGKTLVDGQTGIIKLLDPPSVREKPLGYISAYPPGVRENGGQYTHAAIWYLLALTKVGRQDEAYALFQMINPIEKCRNAQKNAQYMAEPYVLAGDVYSNRQNLGQAGWSWYTGSAGWAYRLIVEGFYGLTRRGRRLLIEPHLPKELDGSIVDYRYENSLYLLEFRLGKEAKITVEGDCDIPSVHLEKDRKQKILITAVVGKGKTGV